MKKECQVPSSVGNRMLRCVMWTPLGKPKAAVVLVHGMIEHIDRYEEFAMYLRRQGYAVVGYDQLGHGKTAVNQEDLGFFAEKKGEKIVIQDIERVVTCTKKQFPGIPLLLFGHSMGSFFVRKYVTVYGKELDGAVFCGTGSMPMPVMVLGLAVAQVIRLVKGNHYRSAFLHKQVFEANNRQIKNPETDRDWLTRDIEKIQENIQDPYCNFMFTTGAYVNFLKIMIDLKRKKGFANIPKKLPVLMIAGGQDPVGHQGEDVAALCDLFREEIGMEQVTLILCEEDRHEILNELDRQAVYSQIEKWMDNCLMEKRISERGRQ